MQLRQRQRRINEDEAPHLACPQLEVLGMVGKPLTTSFLAGVPVHVVSQWLGHASPTITLAVYAHVMLGNQRDAADLFARLVKEAGA